MKKKKNCSTIGGQAVIEGVMMRGNSAVATAVRDPYGNIQIESNRLVPLEKKSAVYRIPFIRGIFVFAHSMIQGMKALTRATEVFGDDLEESTSKNKTKQKDNEEKMGLAIITGIVLGLLFAVALFILVPTYVTKAIFDIKKVSDWLAGQHVFLHSFLPNLVSGFIKISIFIGYMICISFWKETKRLFRYHGAEHKTISAFEHGLDLTVENARTMKTAHDRCGSSFIVILLVFSIIVYSFVPWFKYGIINFIIKLAGLPIITSVSYEILKGLSKYDNWFVRIIKAPGMLLQKLTVKEPDDSMLEVAIAAFKTVQEMEKNPDLQEQRFKLFSSLKKTRKEVINAMQGRMTEYEYINLSVAEQKNSKKQFKESRKKEDLSQERTEELSREADLIIMAVTGKKSFAELTDDIKVGADDLGKMIGIAKRRFAGEPIQYAIGETNFYGYDFIVSKAVLIPRFDTELVAEQTIKKVREIALQKPDGVVHVLDLCAGSGVIGITVALETGADVILGDISSEALEIAEANAVKLGAKVKIVHSNLFENISAVFDIIVSNPPYIKTDDIPGLENQVKDNEPLIALDGGISGLDFYQKISEKYKEFLSDNGYIILELGVDQSDDVAAMFDGIHSIVKDYNNPPVDRVLIIKNSPLKTDSETKDL